MSAYVYEIADSMFDALSHRYFLTLFLVLGLLPLTVLAVSMLGNSTKLANAGDSSSDSSASSMW